ncbi:hypothetical protein Tco_0845360, partial [Tanacetum coccineum]
YSADSKPAGEDPDEDPEEEPSEEEEEELSALADSPPAGLYINLPSEVEEDEVPSTPPPPRSPHIVVLLSQTGLRKARMTVQRIENKAKTGIYEFVSIKSAQYSRSRQSREKSPSMPLERARKIESNGALGSYWASP